MKPRWGRRDGVGASVKVPDDNGHDEYCTCELDCLEEGTR